MIETTLTRNNSIRSLQIERLSTNFQTGNQDLHFRVFIIELFHNFIALSRTHVPQKEYMIPIFVFTDHTDDLRHHIKLYEHYVQVSQTELRVRLRLAIPIILSFGTS